MYLVVGLGNPGKEYEHTRHNAGFDSIDVLADNHSARYWKSECGALTSKIVIADNDVVLAKPQGFMNTSGGPIKHLCNVYGIASEKIIVVHDDLDIEPDRIRVKFGGGCAGHNGLKSIADKLGTRDWLRVRVGIGRPPGRMDAADYVLAHPCKEDAEQLAVSCSLAAEAIESLISCGLEPTQQQFN